MEEFTRAVLSRNVDVHVLINNAGIMFGPRAETDDGHESQFGVNHLVRLFLTVSRVRIVLRSGQLVFMKRSLSFMFFLMCNDLHTLVENDMHLHQARWKSDVIGPK